MQVLAHGHVSDHSFVYGICDVLESAYTNPLAASFKSGSSNDTNTDKSSTLRMSLYKLQRKCVFDLPHMLRDAFAVHYGGGGVRGADVEIFPHPDRPHETEPTEGLLAALHPVLQEMADKRILYSVSPCGGTALWLRPTTTTTSILSVCPQEQCV